MKQNWGDFQLESFSKIFQAYSRNHIAPTSRKFLAKLVFQFIHLAPKSSAQVLYSRIMRVAIWERDL